MTPLPSSTRAQLSDLPQAARCAEQMESWWAAVQELAARGELGGLSLDQHIRRLAGFGASEIGVLVAEQRGQYVPFDTAREMVARKLLQALPQPPDGHTCRGVALEPLIRETFLHQSGAIRRADLTQRVAHHRAARWPWMLATPDDLVVINGVLGVVDYKAPAAPMTDIALEHACQLHQIGLLAEDAGCPVGFRALVAWDLATWSPTVLICPQDPVLEQAIIAAGEHYWHAHVLTGELPPWPAAPRQDLALADLTQDAKQVIETRASRYLRLAVLAKEAETIAEAAREELVAQCRAHGLGQKVATGALAILPKPGWDRAAIETRLPEDRRVACTRPQWDTEALVALVRHLGGNPNPARVTGSLDLDVAAQWLIQQGVPETLLRTMDYRTSLSRRKADQTELNPLRAAAGAAAVHFGATAPASSPCVT